MAFLGGSFEPIQPVGSTIAKTLGDTLKSLAHHKLNQKRSQELVNLGFPKELASIYHDLDPKVQEGIWKQVDLNRIAQQQQQPQHQMQPQQNQQPTFSPEQIDYIKSIPDSNERQRVAQQFQQQNQQQFNPQQQSTPNQQFGQAAAQQQIAQQLGGQRNNNSIFKQPEQPGSDLLAKEEIASQTRKKIVAEKYYEEKLNQGEEAERKLSILNQMEPLVKDLSGQRTSNIARLSGNTILTTSPETQAFDKFAADLLPMGLTEEQLRSERQKFPNSGLSAAANKRLIKDLKNKYIKEVSEANTAQAIVDANGGQLPNDFRKQLHYATKPEFAQEVKKKESKPVEVATEDSQEESTPASLVRNVVSAGAKSISDIAQLPGLPGKIAESVEQDPHSISNIVTKAAMSHSPELKAILPISKAIGKGVDYVSEGINKLTNNYLKPKNATEETVQDYASMIPLYVLGGGAKTLSGIAGFLGKTATGRAVGGALEDLGLGKTGKLIGELGVPALFEIVNLNNMKKHFDPLREKSYENLPGIAAEHKVDASEIEKALHTVNKEAQTRKHSDVIFKNLEHAEGLIKDGQIPLKELQPLKAKLNKAIYTDRLDALEPVLKSVKNASKTHPEYAKELHKADKLHSFILGLDDKIDEAKDFIKDTISSIPVTKKYAVKKGAKVLLDNPKVSASGSLYKLYKELPDQAGKYALEALQAATKKQSGALISSLSKLGQLIERNESEE